MSRAQAEALEWLAERGGDGCFTKCGCVLAQGDIAPHERKTWNALAALGRVKFYGGRRDGGKGRGRIGLVEAGR